MCITIYCKFCYKIFSFNISRQFGDRELGSISPDEILAFLTLLTEGTKQSTRRLRYCLLSAFFNFIKNSVDPKFKNLCETPILRKLFKDPELMARGGMRIGEVLKLTPRDIEDRKLILTFIEVILQAPNRAANALSGAR